MSMFTIVKSELQQRRWYIFWWAIGIVALVALILAIYPAISHSTQFNQALNQLPSSLKSFRGISGDFTSPVGYLNSEIFYLTLPLMLIIMAIGLGSSLLAREEQSGTLELLLARPISRGKLLAAKALSGFVMLLIICGVAALAIIVGDQLVHLAIGWENVFVATGMSLVLALLFGTLALTFTALGRQARLASVGVASLLALGSYLLTSLQNSAAWVHWPARFLPFYYYDTKLALDGNFNWRSSVGMLVVTVVLAIVAWRGFTRRDIG